MFADKTLYTKYFSFFSFRSFGYAKKKALRLAAQAFAFNYKPTFLNNFIDKTLESTVIITPMSS